MLPYWLMFGLLAGAALVSPPGPQRNRPGWWVAALLLVLFVGLRWEVGPDWIAYEYIYSVATQPFDRFMERGDVAFSSIVWLLRNQGFEYWSINLVCSLIFVAGLISFARRLPNPWLAVAVAFPYLIIVVGMSGIRQSAAIGFLFFALGAFSDKRFVAATAFLLIGSLFHASAIMVLGIAAMAMSKNRLAGFAILAVTVLVGTYALGDDFSRFITRYTKYTVESGGVLFRLIMNLVPALIFLWLHRRIPMSDHQRSFWKILSYISVALVPLAFVIPSTTAIDRVSLYIIPLQMFVLSWTPYVLFQDRRSAFFAVAAIIAYLALAMFVFLSYSTYSRAWVPYESILFTEAA